MYAHLCANISIYLTFHYVCMYISMNVKYVNMYVCICSVGINLSMMNLLYHAHLQDLQVRI